MVTTGRNGREMLHPAPHQDELAEIRELNHLFLILLQRRARQGGQCLGLPASVSCRIRDASPAVIRGLSSFPRALFILNLDCVEAPGGHVEVSTDSLSQARHALALTILLTAWNMTRQRDFQARMFLGLSGREAVLLRKLPLSELHRLAPMPELLRCAFGDAGKLWTSLLHHAAGGLPPALHLVGLQPRALELMAEDENPGTRLEIVSA